MIIPVVTQLFHLLRLLLQINWILCLLILLFSGFHRKEFLLAPVDDIAFNMGLFFSCFVYCSVSSFPLFECNVWAFDDFVCCIVPINVCCYALLNLLLWHDKLAYFDSWANLNCVYVHRNTKRKGDVWTICKLLHITPWP